MLKKYISAALALAAVVLFAVSCGKNSNAGKIRKLYENIESYTAEISVTVNSNRTSKTYSIFQYYRSPDSYREDMILPDGGIGARYIFANGSAALIPPNGSGAVTLDGGRLAENKNFMFLPDFFAGYYNSQGTKITAGGDLSGSMTVLELPLSGNNVHRFYQKLWMDDKTCLPVKLETYDINMNPMITAVYKEFKLNEKLNDSIFE